MNIDKIERETREGIIAQQGRLAAMRYRREVRRRRERRRNLILVASATLCILSAGLLRIPASEQEYIVRYGTVDGFNENGDMLVLTEDGNLWNIVDAPEHNCGEELRIMFDSQKTAKAEDDVIIDITERW